MSSMLRLFPVLQHFTYFSLHTAPAKVEEPHMEAHTALPNSSKDILYQGFFGLFFTFIKK